MNSRSSSARRTSAATPSGLPAASPSTRRAQAAQPLGANRHRAALETVGGGLERLCVRPSRGVFEHFNLRRSILQKLIDQHPREIRRVGRIALTERGQDAAVERLVRAWLKGSCRAIRSGRYGIGSTGGARDGVAANAGDQIVFGWQFDQVVVRSLRERSSARVRVVIRPRAR